jgi:precorrin-3B C17-methyltransferase
MSKIFVVGFGPGGLDHMTHRAYGAIDESDIIVGYTAYVDLLKNIFPGKEYQSTGMTKEIDRCKRALEIALTSKTVSVVSSGDSGIYGMAGIMHQVVEESGADVEIEIVPGVTAASSAASVLGAPLMHDFAVISLSDLMTPLELIKRRVESAASSDFVICIYNPKSRKRSGYIDDAISTVLKYRDKTTPIGVVWNIGREGQKSIVTTLGEIDTADINMFSTVVIGNSQTYIKNGLMITPRGYDI